MITIHAGEDISFADRAGVIHHATTTTGLCGSPDHPTVWVLDGGHVRELDATAVRVRGQRLRLDQAGTGRG